MRDFYLLIWYTVFTGLNFTCCVSDKWMMLSKHANVLGDMFGMWKGIWVSSKERMGFSFDPNPVERGYNSDL